MLFLYETRRRKRNAAVVFLQLQGASKTQQTTSVSQNSNVNAPVINFNPQITVSPVMNNTGNGGDARNSDYKGATVV